MVNLSTQRRLASEVLGVGLKRVWFDPNRIKDIAGAMTKDDIRKLIEEGAIRALPVKGTSRKRARELHEKRKKGRRRGHGSRKGTAKARAPKKEEWIKKIRAIRKYLRILKEKGVLDTRIYRKAYLMAKGGFFRSRRHLASWLKEQGIPEEQLRV